MKKYPLLRAGTSDVDCYRQVFENHEYDTLVRYMLSKYNMYDKLRIIDAGANIGLTSIYLKEHFPNAQIIAIEPDPENFEMCVKNMNNAGMLSENFETFAIQAALIHIGAAHSTVEIDTSQRDKRHWARAVKITPSANIVGYTITDLLDMVKWQKAHVLKIDVEGFEQYLFSDIQNADAILNAADIIAIEIHRDIPALREAIKHHVFRNRLTMYDYGETTLIYHSVLFK